MNSSQNNTLLLLFESPQTVFTMAGIALLTGESREGVLSKRLNYYVREGKLQNPRRGIYAKKGYNPEELACLLYTPSYLSLEYVLQKAGVVFQYDSCLTCAGYLSRTVEADGKEYDYEIAAADGKILSADVEVLNNGTSGQGSAGGQDSGSQAAGGQGSGTQAGSAAGSASGDAGNTAGQDQQIQNGAGNANVAVTMEQAISIALERVPGATEKDVKIEVDYDDGVYKYEGDIIHEQREYDFEIDANTGTILEWSEERA